MPYFSTETFDSARAVEFPELAELISETKAMAPASFWEALPVFRRFFASKFACRFLARELKEIDAVDDYDALISDVGIELIRLPAYKLWIGRLQSADVWASAQTELASFANDIIYCNLGPGTLGIEIYKTPAKQINSIFDRESIPSLLESGRQHPGDILSLHAGKHILKITDFGSDVFQIYVVSTRAKSLVWHYDFQTLKPLYCSAGRGRASSISAVARNVGVPWSCGRSRGN